MDDPQRLSDAEIGRRIIYWQAGRVRRPASQWQNVVDNYRLEESTTVLQKMKTIPQASNLVNDVIHNVRTFPEVRVFLPAAVAALRHPILPVPLE